MGEVPEYHAHIPPQWRYGDAGDRYPVAIGDIWQCGVHRFACGDIEEGHAQQFLDQIGASPHAVCVDPPWAANNASAFRTKAGVPRKVDYSHLMSCLFDVIAPVSLCMMMMGNQSASAILDMGTKYGFAFSESHPMFYHRVHPCRLLLFSQQPLHFQPPCADEPIVWGACMDTLIPERSSVFDPCVGRGSIACHAHRRGQAMLGMELHPRRLAVTLDRLANIGAGRPEKIGSIHG